MLLLGGGRVTMRSPHRVGPVAGDGLPLPCGGSAVRDARRDRLHGAKPQMRRCQEGAEQRSPEARGHTGRGCCDTEPKVCSSGQVSATVAQAQRAQPWTEPLPVSAWLREEGGIVRSPPRLTVRAEYLGRGVLSFPQAGSRRAAQSGDKGHTVGTYGSASPAVTSCASLEMDMLTGPLPRSHLPNSFNKPSVPVLVFKRFLFIYLTKEESERGRSQKQGRQKQAPAGQAPS